MAEMLLRPRRGGFLRPFGCGQFIRDFLLGNGPYGSATVDPNTGTPQSDIFHEYKLALMRATALDRAARMEEKQARRKKRPISPDNIDNISKELLARMPYKAWGCRYHSFVDYFSTLRKLKWVELTGVEERSSFQDHYPAGPPRRYYRLTRTGREASETSWANPRLALYGKR